jgi:hypothetical protein
LEPKVPTSHGYYGRPLLKAPVWTWEVPAYFFAGGTAGAAAVIAWVVSVVHGDATLARDARWIAVAGAIVSPALLISDLGRPSRFLNMLRVFKRQSPMSVGAWALVAFSGAAFAALGLDLMRGAITGAGATLVGLAGAVADAAAAATGLLLATYTGVLIGVTAIPVWSRYVRMLPMLFGVSGLGAAVSVLELLGHHTRDLNWIGIGVAAFEAACGLLIELDAHPSARPLHNGRSGAVLRLGGVLIGPLSLALRIVSLGDPFLRPSAAAVMIAGALIARIGWILAGRDSAADWKSALG